MVWMLWANIELGRKVFIIYVGKEPTFIILSHVSEYL